MNNIRIADRMVTIRSTMTEENEEEMKALADALLAK